MAITSADQDLPQPVDTAEMLRAWHLVAISGVVSLTVGVLVLAYPDPSIKLLGVFLGIDLLLGGVLLIVRGVSSRAGENGTPALVLGVLALIAGVVVIRNPGESLVLLVLAFAIYLIAAGALALAQAVAIAEQRGALLVRGVVLIAAGTVIVAWPDISLTTLAVLCGIALCLRGALEIGEAFVLRSAERDAAPA
jgi:uncharacterized membrane protein HdeD (DUF308 family)